MCPWDSSDLQHFSKLYAKYYGVVLSVNEAELKLMALVQLLQAARESHSNCSRNGNSNTVTGNKNKTNLNWND